MSTNEKLIFNTVSPRILAALFPCVEIPERMAIINPRKYVDVAWIRYPIESFAPESAHGVYDRLGPHHSTR